MRTLIAVVVICGIELAQPPSQQPRPSKRETIFEFYLHALNPRSINWGEEIDRRIAVLADHSVKNPYFRVCALQTAAIVLLLTVCWVWWDKMREIKRIGAECLTDAINAKLLADHRALEAIDRHNQHIEFCNRAIEAQESGCPTADSAEGWQREMRNLQTELARERGESARLAAELKRREDLQSKMEARIQQLETQMRQRREGANSELIARLQRAEAELSTRKSPRK